MLLIGIFNSDYSIERPSVGPKFLVSRIISLRATLQVLQELFLWILKVAVNLRRLPSDLYSMAMGMTVILCGASGLVGSAKQSRL